MSRYIQELMDSEEKGEMPGYFMTPDRSKFFKKENMFTFRNLLTGEIVSGAGLVPWKSNEESDGKGRRITTCDYDRQIHFD